MVLDKQLIFYKTDKVKGLVSDFIAYYMACVFLYTGVRQMIDYSEFQNFIVSIEFLPHLFKYFAWILPVAEIVLSVMLVYRKTRKNALYGAGLLLLFISGFLIYMKLYFSPDALPCFCEGVLRKVSWNEQLWFNVILLLALLTGIYLEYSISSKT